MRTTFASGYASMSSLTNRFMGTSQTACLCQYRPVTNKRFTDVKVANPLVELCSSEWSFGITSSQRLASYRKISSCLLDSLRYVSISDNVSHKQQVSYPYDRESVSTSVERCTLLHEFVSSCFRRCCSGWPSQNVPVLDMLARMIFIGLIRTPPSLSIARGPVGVVASLRP